MDFGFVEMRETSKPEDDLDGFLTGVTAALSRAAKRAREIARQTGTAIVVIRAGKLIRAYPQSDDPQDDIVEVISDV